MSLTFRDTVKYELVVSENGGVVSLTKRLNFFREWMTKGHDNVRIKNLIVKYNSRAGPLGSGTIITRVRDNRIDSDLSESSDNTLCTAEFPVSESVILRWESNVWLYKGDLNNVDNPPLIFEIDLVACNMTLGNSVGQFAITCEMAFSKVMDKIRYKNPSAKLLDTSSVKGKNIEHITKFSLTDKGLENGAQLRARQTTHRADGIRKTIDPGLSSNKEVLDSIATKRALGYHPDK
ncbi:4b protein [Wuhan Insect virus 6]|uniref:4b protein n=1 Tax=Wuhan Insect virus 6 TaxID=1608111 RepID=A0A0B5KXN7_9RHAB|nr:4b protein [Wuhan Insect virus 6]AJG39188.1 4b protein [Wuhan Insect virus 6]